MDLRWSGVVLLGAVGLAGFAGCDCVPENPPDGGSDGSVFDPGPDPQETRFDAGPRPDAGPTSCGASCHGGRLNPAPPRDTRGATEPSTRTVGAHQHHLGASAWHREGRCDDCHLVPSTVDAGQHIDASPAELTWAAIAGADGVVPGMSGDTCTVYCHGPSLAGGLHQRPSWVDRSSSQAYCGDCHGVPPPRPHPQNVGSDCSRCHPNAAPGLGFSAPQRHIDGTLDVSPACDSCHGSSANPAPPVDTEGNTSTSLRTVGAHQSHLRPSTWHGPITCEECHLVPREPGDAGHLDPSPAELTWGPLASARGATPSWNGTTCSNYCHGQRSDGGSNQNPTWTSVDAGEAACGTCHSLPPGPPHTPLNAACAFCHGSVIQFDGGFNDAGLHINGQINQ